MNDGYSDFSACPGCGMDFPYKKGKIYCTKECQQRECRRRFDARRLPVQSEKAKKWRASHPGYDRERMKKQRAEYGKNSGLMAQQIIESLNPLNFESEACIIAGDWHIPAHHSGLFSWILDVADEYDVPDIAIPGDFMDADAYSRWPKIGYRGSAFKKEIEETSIVLDVLSEKFENVYICRGNHEKRYIDQNNGHIDMKELFEMCHAADNVHVTNDTYMNMTMPNGDEWLLCHPRQFRQNPLSVARDLAAKYHKNVVSAHGHFFAQGYDRSGRFYCLDGGGIFDPACLQYLRDVYTTPWVSNGFYLIDESGYIPFSLGTEKDGIN